MAVHHTKIWSSLGGVPRKSAKKWWCMPPFRPRRPMVPPGGRSVPADPIQLHALCCAIDVGAFWHALSEALDPFRQRPNPDFGSLPVEGAPVMCGAAAPHRAHGCTWLSKVGAGATYSPPALSGRDEAQTALVCGSGLQHPYPALTVR